METHLNLNNENKIIMPASIFGAGLRSSHYQNWHESENLPYLEVMADNYMHAQGGPALYHLFRIAERTRIVLHGVGMNLGSTLPVNKEYCIALKKLSEKLNPEVVSDHLCFSASHSHNSFDLLPIPFTQTSLNLICDKINAIQDIIQRRYSIENISSYVSYKENTYTEIEFINEVCKKTGCGVLLDVNNVYVSGKNQGYDPFEEIKKINPNYVTQYHISGHSQLDDFLFDTHDTPTCKEVWELMGWALKNIGSRPAILERDDDDAPFSDIIAEINYGNKLLCNSKN